MTRDHPEVDMHVFLIAVVTDSNTDGGKAEEREKKVFLVAAGIIIK